MIVAARVPGITEGLGRAAADAASENALDDDELTVDCTYQLLTD